MHPAAAGHAWSEVSRHATSLGPVVYWRCACLLLTVTVAGQPVARCDAATLPVAADADERPGEADAPVRVTGPSTDGRSTDGRSTDGRSTGRPPSQDRADRPGRPFA